MSELLTMKEAMKVFKQKRTSMYNLKQKCLRTKYQDAVIYLSEHKVLIDKDRFREFLDYNSNQIKKNKHDGYKDTRVLDHFAG